MPDISMCEGTACPLKTFCYRYTAQPSHFSQSYFTDPPFEKDSCKYFVADNRYSKKEKTNGSYVTTGK